MSLPTPTNDNWGKWKSDYKIETPTFQLTPIEKPDMSPLLIHMTGKDAILSILKGDNAPSPISPENGFLKSSIPEYARGPFKIPVVCFSESPTFALEFFRYRSFDRWKDDQRYGIGFDKTELIASGVRPVLYVDGNARKNLIFLHKQKGDGVLFSSDPAINERLVHLFDSIFPFIFPLLEDNPLQGFMWEREWRHSDSVGFTFPHTSIEVICCPAEEEALLRQLLGHAADDIDFIRVWREYDDITNFLRRRQPYWQNNNEPSALSQQQNQVDEGVKHLSGLIRQYRLTLHSLESYEEFVSYLDDELQKISIEKERLEAQIEALQKELNALNAKQKKDQRIKG